LLQVVAQAAYHLEVAEMLDQAQVAVLVALFILPHNLYL
jgi:hypothetical protein